MQKYDKENNKHNISIKPYKIDLTRLEQIFIFAKNMRYDSCR